MSILKSNYSLKPAHLKVIDHFLWILMVHISIPLNGHHKKYSKDWEFEKLSINDRNVMDQLIAMASFDVEALISE